MSARRRLLRAFAAATLAAASVLPAAAQDHWGAIAAGPGDASGQAIEQLSRAAARAAAIQRCGERCTHLVTFYRACAAIAIGAGGYGWASSATVHDAGDQALRHCANRGKDCRLRAVACSGSG